MLLYLVTTLSFFIASVYAHTCFVVSGLEADHNGAFLAENILRKENGPDNVPWKYSKEKIAGEKCRVFDSWSELRKCSESVEDSCQLGLKNGEEVFIYQGAHGGPGGSAVCNSERATGEQILNSLSSLTSQGFKVGAFFSSCYDSDLQVKKLLLEIQNTSSSTIDNLCLLTTSGMGDSAVSPHAITYGQAQALKTSSLQHLRKGSSFPEILKLGHHKPIISSTPWNSLGITDYIVNKNLKNALSSFKTIIETFSDLETCGEDVFEERYIFSKIVEGCKKEEEFEAWLANANKLRRNALKYRTTTIEHFKKRIHGLEEEISYDRWLRYAVMANKDYYLGVGSPWTEFSMSEEFGNEVKDNFFDKNGELKNKEEYKACIKLLKDNASEYLERHQRNKSFYNSPPQKVISVHAFNDFLLEVDINAHFKDIDKNGGEINFELPRKCHDLLSQLSPVNSIIHLPSKEKELHHPKEFDNRFGGRKSAISFKKIMTELNGNLSKKCLENIRMSLDQMLGIAPSPYRDMRGTRNKDTSKNYLLEYYGTDFIGDSNVTRKINMLTNALSSYSFLKRSDPVDKRRKKACDEFHFK